MRTSRAVGVLAVLALPLLPVATTDAATDSAHAAGATVTVVNLAFTPAAVRVGLGESVTWTFQDPISHTVTSDDGFFDTGPTSGGASRTVRFASAGTYAYHCSIHSMMHGKVVVPMAATGTVKDGWKLRWLAGKNHKNRSYDVQVRKAGTSTWTSYKKATTTGSGRFDPGKGTWQARARTHKGSSTSGWSPALRLP
jgi:plastocyanin